MLRAPSHTEVTKTNEEEEKSVWMSKSREAWQYLESGMPEISYQMHIL